MKLKIIRWIALIIGSITSVFIVGAVIFVGASQIGGLINGNSKPINEIVTDFLPILNLILILVGVVIAWFNSRIGGFLITFFTIIQFVLFYEHELNVIQFLILPVGPLLLYYVYYNKWLLKEKD